MCMVIEVHVFTGSHNYLCDVDESLLDHAEQEYGYFNNFIVDDNYKQYAETLCEEVGLHSRPTNHEEALFLYLLLKHDSDTLSTLNKMWIVEVESTM